VLARRDATGVAVSEAEVRAAQRWAAAVLHLVIEPGGAVALAALLAGKVVAEPGMLVILSGGNVDIEAYAKAIAPEPAEASAFPALSGA
jgi:threonine dehydratase